MGNERSGRIVEYTSEDILARLKSGLQNEDSKIEGSFSMDNLMAVSEELARILAMKVDPIAEDIETKIEENITSGNERHFEYWAKLAENADGEKIVGNARAHGVRDGSGIVNVAIITPEATAPAPEDIETVAAYIETQRPVGSVPVVAAAEAIEVTVNGIIELEEGAVLETVKTAIKDDISSYLAEIAFMKGDTVLNYYRIGIIIGETEGVKEVVNYTVNSGKDSLPAEFDEFFTLKDLVLNNVEPS